MRQFLYAAAMVVVLSAVGLGFGWVIGERAPHQFVALFAWLACGFSASSLVAYHIGERAGWRRGYAACAAADRVAQRALAAGRAAAISKESPCPTS